MTPQQLTKWGNDLYEDLYNRWIKWSESCPHIKEKGYALFYSEIKMNPDLMIIGYNPGWTEENKLYEVKRKVPPPRYHDYYLPTKNDLILRKNIKGEFLILKTKNFTCI